MKHLKILLRGLKLLVIPASALALTIGLITLLIVIPAWLFSIGQLVLAGFPYLIAILGGAYIMGSDN